VIESVELRGAELAGEVDPVLQIQRSCQLQHGVCKSVRVREAAYAS
jgi:hypothetical protein